MAAPFDLIPGFAPGGGPFDVIGENYIVLDGNPANNVSTPDAAALDITSDIDLRCEGWAANWAAPPPYDLPALVGKYKAAGDQRSYMLWIAFGIPAISWSTDGTVANADSLFAMAAGQFVHVPRLSGRLALRATLDVDNGAGGKTARFYWADTLDETWIQLGDDVVDAGTTSIHAGTAVLELGPVTGELSAPLNGRIYRAEVRNGIGGTVVAAPDARAVAVGAGSFVASTGETWTLNGDAEVVGFSWVDLPDRLIETDWEYGRDDELDHHPPGVASVVLGNDDRQLDPDHTAGTWFGQLEPRVPFRLQSVWSALDLPGAAGATASTTDTAQLAIPGDLDVRVRLAMDDWTPGGLGQFLVSQWDSPANEGWYIAVLPSGVVRFSFTTDGATDRDRDSTVATGFTNGTDQWVRAVLDTNNGAAGHDVIFYTSVDGITWTPLGTTVTNAGTVTLFNSTANLIVGATADGGLELAGMVRQVEIRSGIAGAVVANPDFMSVDPGATSLKDGAGLTWSVNGAAVVAIDAGLRLDEFYGFVGDDGWQQDLQPPEEATCTVGLTDLLGVMAGYKLPDVYDHAVVSRGPAAYWVLDSQSGSEAVGDLSGNGNDGSVVGDVEFGRATIAPGHGTSAFFDGDADRVEFGNSPILTDTLNASVVATFAAASAPSVNLRVLFIQSNGGLDDTAARLQLKLDGTLLYVRVVDGGGIAYQGPNVLDGAGHIVFGQGDGMAVDTANLSTATTVGLKSIANGVGIGGYPGVLAADHWHGRVGAVAIFNRNLALADRDLILEGYSKLAGQRTDQHIAWALDRIGLPPELRNLAEGTITMGPANTAGRDALEWIREVVATEQGELYVDHRDGGRLRFTDRYHRFLAARSVSVLEAFSDDPAATNVVRVERDDLDLAPNAATEVVNQATVTWRDGQEIVEDTPSTARLGPRPRQIDTQATTAAQARSAGEWVVARYKDPKSRVRGVGADVAAARLGFRAVRQLRVADRITNRHHPQQVGTASTRQLFVEKVAHSFGPGVRWHSRWGLSDVDTFTPWIWGTSAWGIDTAWG